MSIQVVLLSAIVVLVLLGNYVQAKERTADRKARQVREARLDAMLDRLESLADEIEVKP